MSVKAIFYSCQDVGRNIKSSKKRFTWKFNLDSQDHTVDFYVSSLSGKKKIVHNGRTLREESNLIGGFQYSFLIGHNQLMIQSIGDNYDLRINGRQFNHLYLSAKTENEFTFDDGYKKAPEEEYRPPQTKQKRLLKQNQEDENYDIGIADGFGSMAPQESFNTYNTQNLKQKLNLRVVNKPPQQKDDGFNNFKNNFTQPQSQDAFNNFGGFGQQQQQKSNPFGNFDQFGFEPPQQQAQQQNQFGNPFNDFGQQQQKQQVEQFQQPPAQIVATVVQQQKKPQLISLLDDDEPVPQQPQQQHQQIQQVQQPQQYNPISTQSQYQQPIQQQQFQGIQQNAYQSQYNQPVQQQPPQRQSVQQINQNLLDAFDDDPQPVPQVKQQLPQQIHQQVSQQTPQLSINILNAYQQPYQPPQQTQYYQPQPQYQQQQIPVSQAFPPKQQFYQQPQQGTQQYGVQQHGQINQQLNDLF